MIEAKKHDRKLAAAGAAIAVYAALALLTGALAPSAIFDAIVEAIAAAISFVVAALLERIEWLVLAVGVGALGIAHVRDVGERTKSGLELGAIASTSFFAGHMVAPMIWGLI